MEEITPKGKRDKNQLKSSSMGTPANSATLFEELKIEQ
jgi:hypothetical protein